MSSMILTKREEIATDLDGLALRDANFDHDASHGGTDASGLRACHSVRQTGASDKTE